MEGICETCVKRHGDVCEGYCPDEGKQRELVVGSAPENQEFEWPTIPKINEKIPGFKSFFLKLSPQQRVLLSFLLAGFDREEIAQEADITPKTFTVQMDRIKRQSKVLLATAPNVEPSRVGPVRKEEGLMKNSGSPLERIELKLRLWPIPVFDKELTFYVDTKENVGLVKEFYNCFIEPMVRTHLEQLTAELKGMAIAFDLAKKAMERGLDPTEVFLNKEMRQKIWTEEENDGNKDLGLQESE